MKKIVLTLFFLITIFCISITAFAEESCYTASVDGEVSLYLSPSVDSYEIMSVPACSKVNILEKSGSWGLIEYDNKTGWINMSYTRSSYKKAAEATGLDSKKLITVQSDSGTTSLREVPATIQKDDGKGQLVPNGTVLEIYRETPTGWGLVKIIDDYTWIDLSKTALYTRGIDAKQYEIYYVYALSDDGKGVPMWETEKADKVCAVIPDCTQLTTREKSGDYIYVSYAGMNGWINSKYTEISLFNAQVQSGEKVEKCYIVDSRDTKKEVDLLSVPSYKEKDGTNILGTVKDGTEVLVLRSVRGDWNLVQYDDELGWLPPDSLRELETYEQQKSIEALETSEEGYIATAKGKGIKLFAQDTEKNEIAILPETAKVTILAKKGRYSYVMCDYASGWAKGVSVVDNLDDAIKKNADSNGSYTIKKETVLMSMPTDEEMLGSKILGSIEKGTTVSKLKTVTSGEEKWALVEHEGKTGWIKVSAEKFGKLPILAVVGIVSGILVLLAIAAFVIIKRKNNTKKTEVTVKNEENIPDEEGVIKEKTAEVSSK